MTLTATPPSVSFHDHPHLILAFLGQDIRNLGKIGATAMMTHRFAELDDDRDLENLASKFLDYLVRTDARIDPRETRDRIVDDMKKFRDKLHKEKKRPPTAA